MFSALKSDRVSCMGSPLVLRKAYLLSLIEQVANTGVILSFEYFSLLLSENSFLFAQLTILSHLRRTTILFPKSL